MKSPKDNWIKAYSKIMLEWIESQWKIESAHQAGEPYTRMKFEAEASKVEDKLKNLISQVEKDAIEKRTKLLEDSFKHRTKPVINLDDEDKNCDLCGYDHDFMTEANENAYKVAHLKVELSQAIEKTNKRWRERFDKVIGEYQTNKQDSWALIRNELRTEQRARLSDLLEDKK